MNQPNHLLTLDQVAEKLGVSRSTIERRVRDGSIGALKLGASRTSPVRIPERALRQWLYSPRP
jgi:excisionase family DNA binding protein